jgi:hypothetical protein
MPMAVLEEAGDGSQRERRRQGSNFLAAGLHKAAAAGDWAAVQRALVPSVFDPLGLIYHILGFNAHHVMQALNEVQTLDAVHAPRPTLRTAAAPMTTPHTYTDHTRVTKRSTYTSLRVFVR